MAFEINGTPVPSHAIPGANGHDFVLPEPTGTSGQGVPVGAVGKPFLRITYPVASSDCWAYWAGKTGEATYVALTSIQLWNPWKSGGADWDEFTGGAVLHRPRVGRIRFGNYEDVEVLITQIE